MMSRVALLDVMEHCLFMNMVLRTFVWVLHAGASGRKQDAGLLPSPISWERVRGSGELRQCLESAQQ
jgi:hypothetical protein